MTLSIKSICGTINEVPQISNLISTLQTKDTIDIKYHVEDVELTICRHYITVKTATETVIDNAEITNVVGYDKTDFSYSITGLKMGTNYTIQIFCSDGLDIGLSEALQVKTKDIAIYGIKVDENNTNPETAVTYLDDAVGITPAYKTSLEGWADKWPFNKVRLVGLKKGQVTKEINLMDKTKYVDGTTVPTDVDVMVEIPKVYWKFTDITNGYELRISNTKVDSGYDCYAHKVGGIEKDYIYIGAYLGYIEGGKLRSRSGVTPTVNQTIVDFRNYSHNVGSGYQIFTWYSLVLMQILYLILFKHRNGKSVIGQGNTQSGNIKNTGGTNTKGLIYGGGNTTQMCFLGLEDFWGNLYQKIDGMYLNNSQVYTTPDNKTFGGLSNLKYACPGSDTGYSSGSIRNVVHSNMGGFIPKTVNGATNIGYCGYGKAGFGFAIFGGFHSNNDWGGAFSMSINSAENSKGSNESTRLTYLG